MGNIFLTEENERYIKNTLHESGVLGTEILKKYANCFGHGKILTNQYIPRSHFFEYGGVCNKEESYKKLVEFIYNNLKEGGGGLLKNQCASSSDLIVNSYFRPVFLGDEVFHVLLDIDSREDIFRTILEAETGISLVGILVAKFFNGNKKSHKMIDVSSLKEDVLNAKNLITGVYDGESYCLFDLRTCKSS